MGLLEDLVERRIYAAMAEGDFDNLSGRGRPLALDDDCLVPEDLRLAYRVLKNAGYLPEEIVLRRDIAGIHALLGKALDAEDRLQANERLALLRTHLAARSGDRSLHLDGQYHDPICRRFAEGR